MYFKNMGIEGCRIIILSPTYIPCKLSNQLTYSVIVTTSCHFSCILPTRCARNNDGLRPSPQDRLARDLRRAQCILIRSQLRVGAKAAHVSCASPRYGGSGRANEHK